MAIGISPTVDFAFKLMLGNPRHSRVTIHFLNAILSDQAAITQVEFLNPFLEKDSDDDKLAILDILATDEQGRLLNIEMQTSPPVELSQRLAYYASSLYVSQLTEGARYTGLRPAISICVLTRAMFPQVPSLHLDFRLREKDGQILTSDLQIHLLELSKLQVDARNVYHATAAERWAYFLRHAERLTEVEIRRLFPDPEIVEAAGVLEMISKTPTQRMLYDARLKLLRDEESRLRGARQEGLQEGLEQGLEKGLQQGLEKGVIVGRILLLQEWLRIRQWTEDEFGHCSIPQLKALEEQLLRELCAGES